MTTISYSSTIPKIYKDSSIVRTLKDGTIQVFDGNDFKIVKRKDQSAKIITRTIVKKIYITRHIPKNTLTVQANEKTIGLGLQRRLRQNVYINIMGLNTVGILGGIGIGF